MKKKKQWLIAEVDKFPHMCCIRKETGWHCSVTESKNCILKTHLYSFDWNRELKQVKQYLQSFTIYFEHGARNKALLYPLNDPAPFNWYNPAQVYNTGLITATSCSWTINIPQPFV